MKRIAFGLLLVLTLSLFGQVLQRASEAAGVPFLTITVLRDILLCGLFLASVKTVPLLEAKWLNAIALLFTVFFGAYIFASIFQGQFVLGLYYLRLYMLPVLFFVAAKIAFEKLDHAGLHTLLRGVAAINALMLVTAVSLYLTILLFPEHRALIFGADFVPYTWIAAGEGASQMRMGLPMTSPNHLGVYFALMFFLFLLLVVSRPAGQPYRKVHAVIVAMNIMALAATFSRSSMVLAMVSLGSLWVLTPAMRRGMRLLQSVRVGLSLAAVLLAGLLAVELISDGFVSRWIALHIQWSEPSLIGHWQSFVDAYDNVEQYYLYGYPRGTVGPRAFAFYVSDRFNVENSVLNAVYDLGLIGATWLFFGYYLMLAAGYRCRMQLAVALGFLACVQFLPYLFSTEIISLFMFVYLLIGLMDRLNYFDGVVGATEALPASGMRPRSFPSFLAGVSGR